MNRPDFSQGITGTVFHQKKNRNSVQSLTFRFLGKPALYQDLITAAAIDITGASGFLGPDMIEFAEAFVPAFTIWVSVEICFRLGLYGKEGFSKKQRIKSIE